MTYMTAFHRRQIVTAADLRTLLDSIPPDTPLLVGIRDRHHVNRLLGELAVVGVRILPGGRRPALVFDVEEIS
jgi:hypothetical protein